MTLNEYLEERELKSLIADGYDKAILGIGQQSNKHFIIYDKEKVLQILMQDMTREDAVEFFDFNIVGSYVGELTPVFLETLDDLDIKIEVTE